MHLTLFEVLLPIYKHADLKVIKRIEKLREERKWNSIYYTFKGTKKLNRKKEDIQQQLINSSWQFQSY